MLFNSFEYILFFLPIAVCGYFILAHKGLNLGTRVWILACSLIFYSWWNLKYLPLIAGSITLNYLTGITMVARPAIKRPLLLFGLAGNILLLGYYKYTNFLLTNFGLLTGTEYTFTHLALPLAISFFTLQQVAFLVDVYEGSAKPGRFLDYANFVSFFPQLIAGPIVHHREMMPQFESTKNKRIDFDNIAKGITYFAIGLFKKVVVADTFATVANNGFSSPDSLSALESLLAILSYTFQLYFDFGGYMDMAIGAALMFNIQLPINFNSPFKAADIIDFWRRWHITLSNFITTYLYTPLVRAWGPFTVSKSLIAIGVTMLIAGLWHGADWTFIIFGGIHGGALIINHLWKRHGFRMPTWAGVCLTFTVTAISLCFFRAPDVHNALVMIKHMFGANGSILQPITTLPSTSSTDGFQNILLTLEQLKKAPLFQNMGAFDILAGSIIMPLASLAVFVLPNTHQFMTPFKPGWGKIFTCIICFVISFLYLNSFVEKEFLYFDF